MTPEGHGALARREVCDGDGPVGAARYHLGRREEGMCVRKENMLTSLSQTIGWLFGWLVVVVFLPGAAE